jgi:hypothetical protein
MLNFFELLPKDATQTMETARETIPDNCAQNIAEPKPAGNAGEHGGQFDGAPLAHQRPAPASAAWDHTAQRRFKHLAVKEALATITEEELAELESLTSLRRRETASKASAENLAERNPPHPAIS